jgi:hypothetical protein
MRLCRGALLTIVAVLQSAFAVAQPNSEIYYPGATWQRKQPAEVGVNAQLLKEAVDFAIASETSAPRDLKLNHYRSFGREPFGDAHERARGRWIDGGAMDGFVKRLIAATGKS